MWYNNIYIYYIYLYKYNIIDNKIIIFKLSRRETL